MQRNWRSLIRPKRIEIDEKTHNKSYAEFTVQPLERGYGITLGNSLRRVLLSSIQGAAIVSVRFDNVLHEFSTVAGVKEDVTDIILNLKGVRLKLHGDVPRTIKIDASKAGQVKAGDIITDANVEILNPDHVPRNPHQRRQAQGRDGREDGQGLRHGQARARSRPARRDHQHRRHLLAHQEGELYREPCPRGPDHGL